MMLFNRVESKIVHYLRAESNSCSASVYLLLSIKEQAVLNANSKLLVALTLSVSIILCTSEAFPEATKLATEFISNDSILDF